MNKMVFGTVIVFLMSTSLFAEASAGKLLCRGAVFTSPLGLNGAVDYSSESHETVLRLSSPASGNAYSIGFYNYDLDSSRKETIALASLLDSDFPNSTLLMSARPLKAGLQDTPQYELDFIEVRLASDERSAVLSYHYRYSGNAELTAVSEARCELDLSK